VQNGPGSRRVKSSTVIPARAPGMGDGNPRLRYQCSGDLEGSVRRPQIYGIAGGGGAGLLLKSKQFNMSSDRTSRWFSVARPKFSSQNFSRLTWE